MIVDLLTYTLFGAMCATCAHAYTRRTTAAADTRHYLVARTAPSVTPPAPEDVGITPARDLVREADHWRRKCERTEAEVVHRDGIIADLHHRLDHWRARARVVAPVTDPNPMPRFRLFAWWPARPALPWPPPAVTAAAATIVVAQAAFALAVIR